jgi:hypothetical protein
MTFTPANGYVRVRFLDTYSGNFIAGYAWSFLAFVLKDTPDGRCNGTFYAYNGGQGFKTVATLTGQRHSGAATGVNLGSENDGRANDVNAVFDDFRVYDYALSVEEIAYLAQAPGETKTPPDDSKLLLHYDFNETSGLVAENSSDYVYYHPLLSPAELYTGEAKNDRSVDLRDFALLADNWLKEILWP